MLDNCAAVTGKADGYVCGGSVDMSDAGFLAHVEAELRVFKRVCCSCPPY